MNRDVILVLGKTGYGKSVWTKAFTKPCKRLLLYDLCREYPNVSYVDGDTLLDISEAQQQSGTSLLPKEFRLGVWKDSDIDIAGSLAFCEGDCTFTIEETSTIYSRGENVPAWLREIIFIGRHRRVSLIATAQRAASIPIDLRSQANRVVTFCQAEGRDMQWLDDYYGERSEEISTLPKLECLDFKDGEISRYSIQGYINK